MKHFRLTSKKRNLPVTGIKRDIIEDDKKIVNKILFGTEKCKKKDKTITLILTKFSASNYERLNRKKIN